MTNMLVNTLQCALWVNDWMLNWMTKSFSIVNMNDCLNYQHAVFSVKVDSNLLKSVWECSDLKVSQWKIQHPSDTEDDQTIGLTSEDEAEGLGGCIQSCQTSLWWTSHPRGTTCTGSARAPSSCWWGGHEEEGPEACQTASVSPSFVVRTCQRELRPGKSPRSHMRFRLCPEERWPVLCADKSSRCTTEWPSIWAFIGVRNSHVVSVGRF